MEEQPVFLGQEITVGYHHAQMAQKSPGCPDYFIWKEKTFQIAELEREWKDFTRNGRAGRNMRSAHLDRAQGRGSWGVGRFFFRVRTNCGLRFEIYYDRTPLNLKSRHGKWFLFSEYPGLNSGK